jgi:hypothetical protein
VAVLEDISTPAVAESVGGFTGTSISTTSTYGSAAFTPPATSVLVACCIVNYATKTTGFPAFTVSDSASGTWTAGPVISSAASYAKIQFFTRPCVTSPGLITVTFSRGTDTSAAMMALAVRVNTGANTTTPQGSSNTASGSSGSQAAVSVTQSVAGSLLYVLGDWATNQSPSALGGTNSVITTLDSSDGGYLAVGNSTAGGTMGWSVSLGTAGYIAAGLEIVPTGGASPGLSDVAGAREGLAAAVTTSAADSAGAADSIAVVVSGPQAVLGEAAGAEEDLSIAVNQPVGFADLAGAADAITVTIGGAPAPTPGTAIKLASPAFIRSAMPRMHLQNLITGQWFHRDVQGVTSPQITWSLNAPDAFTCALAPPRGDMMDASGNAVLLEWRDAVYLEEADEIKFGGIVTQSTLAGPVWNITAMGFAGYANGMPYEGADYVRTRIDALDVVRYMWSWLQGQPGGNIGLDLGTQKSGFLLGNQVNPGVVSELARDARTGDSSIWIGNAQAFNRNETITISGQPYTVTNVIHNPPGHATGQMLISPNLAEPHKQHEPVVQTSPVFATLARPAPANANNVWLGTSAPFASGELITIAGDQYTVNQVNTDSNGTPTGQITLTTNTRKAYAQGVSVYQVRTVNPFELHWYNATDIGSEMGSIRDEAIFDWREVHTWGDAARKTVHHQLVFGIPRVGGRLQNLRFAEGENIVEAVSMSRDGTKYANNVIGLGSGTGTAQIRVTAADPNTGRLRRTYLYTDQTAYTNARMSAKASKVLTSMKNIDSVTSVVVKNHPNAPFGSFGPGDDIAVQMASGWRNTTIWSRITSMTQDPTTDLMTLNLARSDSFTYIPDTGLAGSMLCRPSTQLSAVSPPRSASWPPASSRSSATSGRPTTRGTRPSTAPRSRSMTQPAHLPWSSGRRATARSPPGRSARWSRPRPRARPSSRRACWACTWPGTA